MHNSVCKPVTQDKIVIDQLQPLKEPIIRALNNAPFRDQKRAVLFMTEKNCICNQKKEKRNKMGK